MDGHNVEHALSVLDVLWIVTLPPLTLPNPRCNKLGFLHPYKLARCCGKYTVVFVALVR